MANLQDTYTLDTRANTGELEKAGDEVDALVNQIDTANTASNESARSFKKGAGGIDSFAGAAAGAVTAIAGLEIIKQVTGFLVDAVAAGMDFETQMNRLQAATGATDAEMANLEQSARDVWLSGFGESPEEIATAMATITNITGAMGDELTTLTTNALVFGQTFDKDVLESTRAANQLMTQFGVSGEEAFDLLAFTMQATGDPADDLLDTINEYSSTFAEMGLTAEESFNALMNGADNGIYSFDKSADALREFNIRFNEGSEEQEAYWNSLIEGSDAFTLALADGTTQAVKDFDHLRMAVADGRIDIADAGNMMRIALQQIEDPAERAAAATALIGTQYEDLGDDILGAFTVGGIGEFDGKMQDMANTLSQGLAPKVEQLKRNFMMLTSEALLPLVNTVVDAAIPAIEDLTFWIQEGGLDGVQEFADSLADDLTPILEDAIDLIEDITKEVISFAQENPELVRVLTYVVGAVGAVVGAFIAFSGIMSGVMAVVGGASTVIGVIGAAFAFLLSPIGLVIAAVAGLALAYQTNFMGIRDTINNTVNDILPLVDALVGVITRLWNDVQPALQALWGWISTNFPIIANTYIAALKIEFELLQAIVVGIWDAISPALTDMYNWLVTNFPAMRDIALTVVEIGLYAIQTAAVGIWDTISPVLQAMYDWLVANFPAMRDTALAIIEVAINAIATAGSTLWEVASVGFQAMYDWINANLPTIQAVIDSVRAVIAAVIERGGRVWDATSGAWQAFSDNIGNLMDSVTGALQPVLDLINDIISAAGDVGGAVGGALDAAGGLFGLGNASGTSWTGSGAVNEIAGFHHQQEAVIPHGGMRVIPSPRGVMVEGMVRAAVPSIPNVGNGGSSKQPMIIHTHVSIDRKEVAKAVKRVEWESAPDRSRPTPSRLEHHQ